MPEQTDNLTFLRAQVKRRQGQKPTKEERAIAQDRFIESFKLNMNITVACTQANISRDTFYKWCEHDEPFSVRYHQAEQMATDVLLAAAWRRAVQGVEKNVVSMGKVVYVDAGKDENGKTVMKPLTEREYSDAVLLRLMSWRIPGFREKTQVEHSGNIDITGSKESLMAKLGTTVRAKNEHQDETE